MSSERQKRRSVYAIEFQHPHGWTPFDTKLSRRSAWREMKKKREIFRAQGNDFKLRVIRYDASK